ncbi:MAG TPA: putative toxin-antitoxin system toxin component, PIN family [Lysobacter sp.]
MAPAVPTFVLDTNAWLDLLVFRDPALDGFEAAARARALRIAIDERALDELARVLRYEPLRLQDSDASACLVAASALAQRVAIDTPPRLPRCRDPDDQMFLEIAVAVRADAILSRDAELLRLHRRMQREHGVTIVTPAGWRDVLAQMSKR